MAELENAGKATRVRQMASAEAAVGFQGGGIEQVTAIVTANDARLVWMQNLEPHRSDFQNIERHERHPGLSGRQR